VSDKVEKRFKTGDDDDDDDKQLGLREYPQKLTLPEKRGVF
jgi:hypothetical protein